MAESHPYFDAIKSKLLDDAVVPSAKSLTNSRIFSDQLPDRTGHPAIRMALIFDKPHIRLNNSDSVTADVQLDVYSALDQAAKTEAFQIDRLIRRELDRVSLTVTGFGHVRCQQTEAGHPIQEHPFFRVTSRYRIFGSART